MIITYEQSTFDSFNIMFVQICYTFYIICSISARTQHILIHSVKYFSSPLWLSQGFYFIYFLFCFYVYATISVQGTKFSINNQGIAYKQVTIPTPTYQKSLFYLSVKHVQSYLNIIGVVFRRIAYLLK